MHSAARNAYYNRGSKAAWDQHVEERDTEMRSVWMFSCYTSLAITAFVACAVPGNPAVLVGVFLSIVCYSAAN